MILQIDLTVIIFLLNALMFLTFTGFIFCIISLCVFLLCLIILELSVKIYGIEEYAYLISNWYVEKTKKIANFFGLTFENIQNGENHVNYKVK